MPIDLTAKPIVITGASSGIGAATALACAAAGMPVGLGARRADKLAEVVAAIERAGGQAFALATDVTRPEQCAALVGEAVRRYGSLYGAYANAGYGEEVCIDGMDDGRLRAIFETNFFGTLNLIRPALAAMRRNPPAPRPTPGTPRGHVLICSSCLALFAVPCYGAYSATKAAQLHIGRSMRYELGPEGIEVSTVHPIGTRTELFDKMAERSGPSRFGNHTPERFMQTSQFVADRTVACLRRPRAEVWTGAQGHLIRTGMAIGAMFPTLSDRAVRALFRRQLRVSK